MRRLAGVGLLLLFAGAMFGQFGPIPDPAPTTPNISDPSTLVQIYQNLQGNWFAAISGYAMEIFFALAALDVAWFGIELWRTYHGDLSQAMTSSAMKILTIGMFLALLQNGGTWVSDIIASFSQIGKDASGLPGLGPSVLLLQGVKIGGTLLGTAMMSGAFFDLATSASLILAAFIICLSFLVICFQFIVTQVQAAICLGVGYIFLGFGGSKWTAPYVERYFAFAVATGVKLMTLYCVAGGAWSLTQTWVQQASAAPFNGSGVEVAWVIMCSAILYAGICWYIPSIAGAMLGGSPNLSHSDFLAFAAPIVSGAVAAGLAAAGIATGGASLAGAGAVGAAGAGTAAGGGAVASGAATSPSGVSLGAVGQLASAGSSAAQSMPHGGSHQSAPPHFNGFNHG